MGSYVERNLNFNEKVLLKAKTHFGVLIVAIVSGVVTFLSFLIIINFLFDFSLNNGSDEPDILRLVLKSVFPVGVLIFSGASVITKLTTYFCTELAFTNKRVIGKAGFVDSASLDAPLGKIQNVSVSTGLFGKIFGYGTIEVKTAGGHVRFDGICEPDNVKRFLMNQIEAYENERILMQAQALAETMKRNGN